MQGKKIWSHYIKINLLSKSGIVHMKFFYYHAMSKSKIDKEEEFISAWRFLGYLQMVQQ